MGHGMLRCFNSANITKGLLPKIHILQYNGKDSVKSNKSHTYGLNHLSLALRSCALSEYLYRKYFLVIHIVLRKLPTHPLAYLLESRSE